MDLRDVMAHATNHNAYREQGMSILGCLESGLSGLPGQPFRANQISHSFSVPQPQSPHNTTSLRWLHTHKDLPSNLP